MASSLRCFSRLHFTWSIVFTRRTIPYWLLHHSPWRHLLQRHQPTFLVTIPWPQCSYIRNDGFPFNHAVWYISRSCMAPSSHDCPMLGESTHGDTYLHGPFDFASMAERLVIALDRIVRTRLLLKLWCSQIESPVLIFLHIPFKWTMAFIQYSLAWLRHRSRLMNLRDHCIHDRPSRTKGPLKPPPPIFLFYIKLRKMPQHIHMDCHKPWLDLMWRGMKSDNSFLQLIMFRCLVRSLMQFWLGCLIFYFRAT